MISKMRRLELMRIQRQLRRAQWRAKLQLAALKASKGPLRRSRRLSPR